MPHVFLSYVFLSYARSDAPLVDIIARDLAHQGVSLWMDQQLIIKHQNRGNQKAAECILPPLPSSWPRPPFQIQAAMWS
jgi:hypothetical protein